jgi:hypothetical protein
MHSRKGRCHGNVERSAEGGRIQARHGWFRFQWAFWSLFGQRGTESRDSERHASAAPLVSCRRYNLDRLGAVLSRGPKSHSSRCQYRSWDLLACRFHRHAATPRPIGHRAHLGGGVFNGATHYVARTKRNHRQNAANVGSAGTGPYLPNLRSHIHWRGNRAFEQWLCSVFNARHGWPFFIPSRSLSRPCIHQAYAWMASLKFVPFTNRTPRLLTCDVAYCLSGHR